MNTLKYFLLLVFVIVCSCVHAESEKKIRALFDSLDQTSITQQLSFYELYPHTKEGHQALQRAWQLLAGTGTPDQDFSTLPLDTSIVQEIVHLVNKEKSGDLPLLSKNQLDTIESFARRLGNRKLKGFHLEKEEEILQLPEEEIDLARAVLISQKLDLDALRSYEAMLDLMALQIQVRLTDDSPKTKILAINHFIFEEMGFRFPPHSKYAKDIDLYTFLPSVLDSRHGVCLGVTILYLSIAQRLGLFLEVVTPPGHIYVRFSDGNEEINIETTARGIHVDSKEYLGIDTRKLQKRNLKEVVGFAYINHASLFLKEEKYDEALKCYEHAKQYLPEDKLLRELMGYCYLFRGEIEKGEILLDGIKDYLPDYAVVKNTQAEDYLTQRADIQALKTLFLPVDESRASVLEKKNALEEVVKKFPAFRQGWLALGIAWMQLHRGKEALDALEKRYALDPKDPTVTYYLSVISAHRFDFQKAWKYLKETEKLVLAREHLPQALKTLRRELALTSPE